MRCDRDQDQQGDVCGIGGECDLEEATINKNRGWVRSCNEDYAENSEAKTTHVHPKEDEY